MTLFFEILALYKASSEALDDGLAMLLLQFPQDRQFMMPVFDRTPFHTQFSDRQSRATFACSNSHDSKQLCSMNLKGNSRLKAIMLLLLDGSEPLDTVVPRRRYSAPQLTYPHLVHGDPERVGPQLGR